MFKKRMIKKMMKNKRGISPLIATVLLIAFAVALGAVVMSWGKAYVTMDDTERVACSKVELKIHVIEEPQLSFSRTENYLNFMIDNTGGIDIKGVRIWVIGEKENMITNIEEEIKQGYPLRKRLDYNFGVYGNIKQVNFVPKILMEGKEIVCANQKLESSSLTEE